MQTKNKGLAYGTKAPKTKGVIKPVKKNWQCKTAGTFDCDDRTPSMKK